MFPPRNRLLLVFAVYFYLPSFPSRLYFNLCSIFEFSNRTHASLYPAAQYYCTLTCSSNIITRKFPVLPFPIICRFFPVTKRSVVSMARSVRSNSSATHWHAGATVSDRAAEQRSARGRSRARLGGAIDTKLFEKRRVDNRPRARASKKRRALPR